MWLPMWWGNKNQSHTLSPHLRAAFVNAQLHVRGDPPERSAGERHTNYSGWDTATLGLTSSATAYAALKVTGVAVGSVLSASLASTITHVIIMRFDTMETLHILDSIKNPRENFQTKSWINSFCFVFWICSSFCAQHALWKPVLLKYCRSGMNWILTGVLSRKTSSRLLTMSWKYRHHYLPLSQ